MQESLKYKQQLLSCQLLFGSFCFAWFGSSSFGSLGFCGLLDRSCLAGFFRTSQTSPSLLGWFLCPSRFLSRLSLCPLRLWLLRLCSSFRADLKWSRCSSAFGLNQATAGHQSLYCQFDARVVSYNIITTGSQSFLQSDQRDATALLWRWQDLEDQIRHAGSWLLGLGPSSGVLVAEDGADGAAVDMTDSLFEQERQLEGDVWWDWVGGRGACN